MTFKLSAKQLALLTDDMQWMVEPGEFVISAGGGQPGVKISSGKVLSKSINITGDNFYVDLNKCLRIIKEWVRVILFVI